jgi:oxaloacetate decarboxylase (Na+ extruding) subunit alpha
VPALVDTSIRLLSQEPLAGRIETSRLLNLAGLLDEAGFAYLEVSGGGCFDAMVRRAVESPWERIRALRARCETPLGIALRGRFLVGGRPLSRDLVRRFVRSAAESGIDVFRIHDPLNDLANLEEAAEAVRAAGKELAIGLVHSPAPNGETDLLAERAGRVRELGATRVLVHDPAGSLDPATARDLVAAVREASGLPVGLHCQGAAGAALAASMEAARGGADLVACAIYPVALTIHRVSAEAATKSLAAIGIETGVDVDRLWEACELVDDALGEEPVAPLSPRVAVRAAEHAIPAGLVAELDQNLRAQGFADRLDDVLEEMQRVRVEVGSPPLAAPIGQILGQQALLHVLSAQRWTLVVDEVRDLVVGRYGSPPGEIDAQVRRAIELQGDGRPAENPVGLDEIRQAAEGLAASEEELLLLALFGAEAEPLLAALRNRGQRHAPEGAGLERRETDRLRELIRVVQESGIAEVTIEEGETRITVRRTDETEGAPEVAAPDPFAPPPPLEPAEVPPAVDEVFRVESPMVGTFYRAPAPGEAPFVEEGDVVIVGQTLCILEAMKLMNEVKADREGRVRRILVENAEPVQYGDVLFELEPLNGRPLDAL